MKLEARHHELKQTVRILQRKIYVLEQTVGEAIKQTDSNVNIHISEVPKRNSTTQTQLQRINDRVTNFVLNRIDIQLSKLDGAVNLSNENPSKMEQTLGPVDVSQTTSQIKIRNNAKENLNSSRVRTQRVCRTKCS